MKYLKLTADAGNIILVNMEQVTTVYATSDTYRKYLEQNGKSVLKSVINFCHTNEETSVMETPEEIYEKLTGITPA